MLGSGCFTCIVPISRQPKEAKKHVTHSDVHIKGVNGSITALFEFRHTLTSGYTVHTVPIIPASSSAHGPAYGALTIHNNNQPTIRPQPNINTLDQKLNWLKRSGDLSLPNHPNLNELEATEDLPIGYADIIGIENGIKGTFI